MFYNQLSGVKPIFILKSDVLGKPKADSGPDNGYKNEFLVPTEVYRTVGQHINVSNMIGLQRVRGLPGIFCVKVYRFVSKHQGR
jgi:hypothetical protein